MIDLKMAKMNFIVMSETIQWLMDEAENCSNTATVYRDKLKEDPECTWYLDQVEELSRKEIAYLEFAKRLAKM